MSQDLGLDRSGNGNNWTLNNMTFADQMIDVPKNNYCTLNPLHHDIENHGNNLNRVYSEGNLKISTDTVAGVSSTFFGTMGVTSGKWYYEAMTIAGGNVGAAIGIANYNGGDNMYYYSNGNKYYDGGSASYGASYANLDVVGVAFNADTNAITFYKNGVSQGEITSAITGGGHYFPAGWDGSGSLFALLVYNFGQDSSFAGNKTAQGKRDSEGIGDFYYNVPSGYKALCTSNLPAVAVTPSEHFNTVLYTGDGDGSGKVITGVGFQPDFVWIKDRTHTESHRTYDSVRGVTIQNGTNSNYIDWTDAQSLQSFDTDGFTVGNENAVNNDHPYVSWNWKAGNATLGTGDFTQGNLASTCSRNVDAGFSIVSYTGNLTNAATIGHGLSKAPDIVILKNRERTSGWRVGGAEIGNGSTKYLTLNTTAAIDDASTGFQAFTSTTFQIGNDTDWNASGEDIIAYCFHSVDGYSKVGSFSGNSKADGTFVYCGFKPALVIQKGSDHAHGWQIWDNKRDPHNVATKELFANGTTAEYTDATYTSIDFVSNGFKLRTSNSSENSGENIFLAFAETPFKYSNAR